MTHVIATGPSVAYGEIEAKGGIKSGGGVAFKGQTVVTVSVNPPSIAAGAEANVDVTVTGVAAGDFVSVRPPLDLEAGLFVKTCGVQAADTVRIVLGNEDGGAVDGAAKDWQVFWIDLT